MVNPLENGLLRFTNCNLLNDIYYNEKYSRLYANGESQLFKYNYNKGSDYFINIAIKSPINNIKGTIISDGFYDLETPYGYGGYLTNSKDNNFIKDALLKYREYCRKEKIVAEFVRFHPFNNFPVSYGESLDMCINDRKVVIVDLKINIDQRWAAYHSKTRNILRKCAKQLDFVFSKNIAEFMELYNQTMARNMATDFYYFNKNYFSSLIDIKNIYLAKTKYNKETTAAGFFMLSGEIAHYHLSANNKNHLKLNSNYFLLDQMFEFAKRQKCKYFLLGGGRTSNSKDTLLKFKKKFSSVMSNFYIAGNVFNSAKYKEYVSIWEKGDKSDIKYFLKYRL